MLLSITSLRLNVVYFFLTLALSPVAGLAVDRFTQTSITAVWDEVTNINIPFMYEVTISPEPSTLWKPKNGRWDTLLFHMFSFCKH